MRIVKLFKNHVLALVCAVALIGLIAVAGAIEGTAPSGMYY